MNSQKTCLLTPQGKEKLEQELAALRSKRPEALEELARARAMGDLKENSAYQAARERLTNLDRRITKLEIMVRTCVVVTKKNNGTVQLGSIVEAEVKGKTMTITIVGDNEANPKEKKISAGSPLGEALLSRSAGDTIILNTPAGSVEYKVLTVS